jgi:hypothetical protein
VRSVFAVVATGLRLLGRHWPALFAILLVGFAARDALIWLAVKASKVHAVVGMLTFALVPISLLAALILMLRVIRSSLPGPAGAAEGGRPSTGVIAHVASVLVPFLAVYASFDFFTDDKEAYVYRITKEEIFGDFGTETNIESRLPFEPNPTLIAVVIGAFVLRWLLGKFPKIKQIKGIGFFEAYLEVIWLTLAVAVANSLIEPAENWVGARRLTAWATGALDSLIGLLGPLAGAGMFLKEWAVNLFNSIDTVIVVPVAWLAVGAVIYGHRLAQSEQNELPAEVQQRWNLLPAAVRRIAAPLRSDMNDSFSPLLRGLRMLRDAGLKTMLLFCLAFVAAKAIPDALWELERLIIGPRDIAEVWAPASGPLGIFNNMVGTTVLICLVAAAVDYVLNIRGPAGSAAETTAPVAPGQPAGPAPAQRTPANSTASSTAPANPTAPASSPAQQDVAGVSGYPSYLDVDGLGGGR